MSQSTIAPETVLVVDSTASSLAGVSLILKNSGFNVLSASTPEEAMKISADFAGTIELLLTEVMMPGMSGPDLAKKLMVQRTRLRVMMMTGYADGELLILNYGWHMVQKPSVAKVLSEKVKAILHSPDRSQGPDLFDTRNEFVGTHEKHEK
jgi:two-component system cell cycle sensor histidine kinase/response regulator CckA